MKGGILNVSNIYNPDVFPKLFIPNGSGPITEDNLQIDDFALTSLRSEKPQIEGYDPDKFTKTLDKIFEESDNLLKIRSILLVFALKNIIDVSVIFGYLITEDKIKPEVTDEEFEKISLFEENSRYFNDIFYNELSKHPVLMLDVIETIYSFYSKNSSQYEQSYYIIYRTILANESALLPVQSDDLYFMEEEHVGKFKNQIISLCPIILPFSMKKRDYVDDDRPALEISFYVDRSDVLKTVWSFDSLNDFDVSFNINFINETGTDCGGLTKEFIRLAFEEIFKPETGLFDKRNEFFWFRYHNYENPAQKRDLIKKYYCVGILLGLVVLNKFTIPYHFPPYFYKKLLHRNLSQVDLNTFDPELFRALINLVNQKLEESSLVDYTYIDSLSRSEIDLISFKDITNDTNFMPTPLVDANKGTYITRIAEWVFDVSIREEFEAFELGFCKIRRDPMLYHAFRLDELDRIFSGDYIRNWDELKEGAYFSGYPDDSNTKTWFWQYFDNLDEKGKLNVLKFITASTSVPIGGLQDLKIKISYSGVKGLPVAHTCFNTLELPEYESYDVFKEKCDLAFAYSNTFTCS